MVPREGVARLILWVDQAVDTLIVADAMSLMDAFGMQDLVLVAIVNEIGFVFPRSV